MDLEKLVISIIFCLSAILYYIVHKSWLKSRNKDSSSFRPMTTFRTVKDWTIIIALSITSLFFLFQTF